MLAEIWYWVAKVLAVLAIPLMVFSAVMMVRSVGKEQAVKPPPLLLQVISPFLVLSVYGFFLKLEPPEWLALGLLVVGIGLGVFWSRSVKMQVRNGVVISKRSALYVVVWAFTLILTQTLAVFASSQFTMYAFSTMYLSAGIAAGLNVALLVRGQSLHTTGVPGQ